MNSWVISYLLDADNYPFKTQNIQLLQTHASYIFIARPYVLKIKKQVNFGFLNFSTLEKRFYFSVEEIKLNRKLCKNLYLNLFKIYIKRNKIFFETIFTSEQIKNLNHFNSYLFFQENIRPFLKQVSCLEFAIQMHYIEDIYFLKNQEITYPKLEAIVNKLYEFYSNSKIIYKNYLLKNIKSNFRFVEPFIGKTIDYLLFRYIKKFNLWYLKKYQYKISSRKKDGWIRNCHGDLHLEHIMIKEEHVCIYDCIEFNKQFRHIDIANDIAFLCMDLEFHGKFQESYFLMKLFYKKFYDYDSIALQDLYRCYRAFVRGKVYSLKSIDSTLTKEEREESTHLAKKYFQLSFQYALKDIHPTLFVFMGRVGSGKTTLAKKLADLLGIHVYSSDVIRKQLFGIPIYEKTPEELKNQVYTRFITYIVYKKMIEMGIEKARKNGIGIIDATFASKRLRNLVVFRSFEENVKLIFIEIYAEKEIILKRLKNRFFSSKESSDAGIEEFESFYHLYEPPVEIPSNQRISFYIHKERNVEELFIYLLKKIFIHRFLYKHPY